MIYGPYSTGWRDECERRNGRRRQAWAWFGVAMTLAASAAVWGVLLWAL